MSTESGADAATATVDSAPAAENQPEAAASAPTPPEPGAASPDAAAQATPSDASAATGTTQSDAAPLSDNLTPEEIQHLRALKAEMATLGKDVTGYKGVLSWGNKHARAAHEAKAQLEALQAQQKARDEQQRREAEQAKLRQWHAKHPEHGRFQSLIQRAKDDDVRLAAIPRDSEAFQALADAIRKQWSPEDTKLLAEWHEHREAQIQAVMADPEGYVTGLLDRYLPQAFQARMQEWEGYRSAQTNAEQFFAQNKELIESKREDLLRYMQEGMSHNRALELVKLQQEVATLKGQRGTDAEAVARSQAHLKANEQAATVRRDSRTVELGTDPVAEARKQGLVGEAMTRAIMQAARRRA